MKRIDEFRGTLHPVMETLTSNDSSLYKNIIVEVLKKTVECFQS